MMPPHQTAVINNMNEYLKAVQLYLDNGIDLRYGQGLFNVLLYHNPELAEQIRGTTLDPFHWEQGTRTDKFIEWLRAEI